MKTLLKTLLIVPLVLVLLSAASIGIALQQGLVTQSVLLYLVELAQRDGIGAVAMLFQAEWGMELNEANDASFGRRQIDGRGHAPWVIRGNLDDRPRVINLALAPGLWAAYDTEQASLYQVWEGDILFQGAVYDYRHGPQPASRGSWYVRNREPARWFIEQDGTRTAATVRYLGHQFFEAGAQVELRYRLSTDELSIDINERPDVLLQEGSRSFIRLFRRGDSESTALRAGFYAPDGSVTYAEGLIVLPLDAPTPIADAAVTGFPGPPGEEILAHGQDVIANSDCLGCHAPGHRVVGPAWAEIAGKFQGRMQDEVIDALSERILIGGVGNWGQVPMPPHPDLMPEDVRAAVTYILSTEADVGPLNPPLNGEGEPFTATREYSIRERLTELHPSFTLEDLAPVGFEPKVGGMDFRPDGKLLLASWDLDGAVYLVDTDAASSERVRRIADGLHEPLGLVTVEDRLFVLQKQELTELIDLDGDELIDRYDSFSYDWPTTANFHSFAFGLLHRDDAFKLLLSICVLPGGASCPEQQPTQGKLLSIDMQGAATPVASGFRTPNGIAEGPGGRIVVADNQGDWLPASKLVAVREGGFYGSRAVPDPGVMEREELAPIVWLPQDEIGNSPTQPLLLEEGPYAGQMIHGDVYNGGVKRVFIEEVEGQLQGAAFQFSAGFKGAVNRLQRGPDGAIYIGEVGNPPNWGEYGKAWHGLERMRWAGNRAFEILAVEAESGGFTLTLTQPLNAELTITPSDLVARQWFYHPNEQYGGPKYDEQSLPVAALELSADRRQLRARIPGLRPGYVVYLRLDDRLRSADDGSLWSSEAWYTLNTIPARPAELLAATALPEPDVVWESLFDGETLDGWRNYRGEPESIKKWAVVNGELTLQQEGLFPMWDLISGVIFGWASGDLIYTRERFENFELSLEWKIAEGGNSGIFYLVADEDEHAPFYTGLEMQVLDDAGHYDGKIETHRAGDLYGLYAGDPQAVKPPGVWNSIRIRVEDNRIEHWVNGQRVLTAQRGSEDWNERLAASKFVEMPRFGTSARGYIVLQDHGDPVWYRNIRIRRMP